MRYVQIRAFHYVAIHGGFSLAAEALHLTQPAISDQVRRLEAENDVRLFDRNSKKVTLTADGHKLLEITRRMFEAEQDVVGFLSETRALSAGRLNIMADSAHHVLPVLSLFRQRYPEIFISLRVGNSETVLNSLHDYESDIGVLGEIPENQEYQSLTLSSSPIIAFAEENSPFVKKKKLSLADLASLPLVLREKGSKTRAKLEDVAASCGVSLKPTIEAEGREAVRAIVAAGGGVGIVSEAEFGSGDGLVKILITEKKLIMDEALVILRERKDSKLVDAFMSLAREIN
ncbi:MAG: LysR family transcriptional regulator [Gammaproteobacteria bacterium]|nr:LysR family transcriptional regulator [Gammaproteobacteria bacterium]